MPDQRLTKARTSLPSLARRLDALEDAIKHGENVRVGMTYRVVYPLRFRARTTDEEFARVVRAYREGRPSPDTVPPTAAFVVTPELKAAIDRRMSR